MLSIVVPGDEYFDNDKEIFVYSQSLTIKLEHSLASLSKWESFWEKPFISTIEKTTEETNSYIYMMFLDDTLSSSLVGKLTPHNIEEIEKYINAKMTATTFSNIAKKTQTSEIITSEIIYYWMMSLNIPFETQHWHLERLLTLIRVCSEKNAPKQKVPMREIIAQRKALNAKRKQELGTTG